MTAGRLSLEIERVHEREQREVPCLRKTVLALRLSSKKGILRVSLDVCEIGFWRVENTFRWGVVFLVEKPYSWQRRPVPCLGTTDSKHEYVICIWEQILGENPFVSDCLEDNQKRLLGKRKRKYFFLSVFGQPGRWNTEPHDLHSRFQLPSVKYAVDYKSMIGGYKPYK